ncbi:TonB-dependent receptor [Anditalea andensis]|nr:TonB-dependent receptor [Anditalea andensis]
MIKGLVIDSDALPLPGATVVIKGTENFVITDGDGKFNLYSAHPSLILQVNYVGYKLKEIQLSKVPDSEISIQLEEDALLEEILVTSRRRTETAQNVPIPITVVGGPLIADAGAFNVNRVKELVPSVQLYSSNPRNTTLNIRGLGSTFGLTNDGIDPGVGFYVDGVYYARPAATTLDFIDVDQIEVLRGPQGTLFGKNTTAGAFNITTRQASFTPGANFELSYGNYGFIQAKSSITGPLSKTVAARLSFSGTQRNGLIENVVTGRSVNDLNNLGVRGQILFIPTDKATITLSMDASSQRPDGYAQVVAGVAPTLRPEYRQFDQIIADLGYSLPSRNAFDRVIDHDTPWRSNQNLGGISLNVDFEIGSGTLTSTSAWRYWDWDPSNDRDFTGLPVLSLSQAPSKHRQWSQEIRYAGSFLPGVSGVVGIFALGQDLWSDPYHSEESGSAQWRFSQNTTSPLWQTPGLFEGYGIRTTNRLESFSGAVFGQLDWAITDRLHLLPGLRYNYDDKKVNYLRQTYGGLQTEDPALIALQRAVYNDQAFDVSVDDFNLSGQITLSYQARYNINTFATYSTGYKPVGLNLGGLPSAGGSPLLELAVIRPEAVQHFELGIKSNPTTNSTLNFTVYNTDIKDYQTIVQTAELGVNRGYLSNAERVRVMGAELDANIKINKNISFYGGLAYTDGIYVSFANAPVPLEETGGDVAFKDISGEDLPGISKFAGSIGGEISRSGTLFEKKGKTFFAYDVYYRSSYSSSPSPSQYLMINGYALTNMRAGFRATEGTSFIFWVRNLFDVNYFEMLLPGAGNAGHYAGVLGDQRTFGITIRHVM